MRAYADNAAVTLTGENTLRAYWMRDYPREVSTTVTVNLPSDYNEVVCGYVEDMQVCLTPLILMVHTIYIEKCINRVNKKSLTSYLTKAIKNKRKEK